MGRDGQTDCMRGTGRQRPGPWFNIKMSSYQYRKSNCGDKTVVRSSYLHNGISYIGKMTSLYWIRAQDKEYFTKLRHEDDGSMKHHHDVWYNLPRLTQISYWMRKWKFSYYVMFWQMTIVVWENFWSSHLPSHVSTTNVPNCRDATYKWLRTV